MLRRSRQPIFDGAIAGSPATSASTGPLLNVENYYGDELAKKGYRTPSPRRDRAVGALLCGFLCCAIFLSADRGNTAAAIGKSPDTSALSSSSSPGRGEGSSAADDPAPVRLRLPPKTLPSNVAPMGSIVYGAKSKGQNTAKMVKAAIESGFRHIATGGFHDEYNEAGVGVGWKQSGVPREAIYLQTLFVARSVKGFGADNCKLDDGCPPSPDLSIEDQVRLSVRSSLHNLQTYYIDAVLVHNFRAKLQPYEDTLRAWRVLENYVDEGVIRHLGIVSVHDEGHIRKLYRDAKIKPAIIQNRFHSNRGYDVGLRPLFKEYGMANQLFWVITGSAGGKANHDAVKRIAEEKGVSPKVLIYSFAMEIGGTPLIGTKNINHMKEDVDALVTNKLRWTKEELIAMAQVINKSLVQ